ncbi:MAG TPA: hypothetical protein VHN98_03270 [Acidimicrobiales bacterium]|nr:hypothetical protein [Acidimicrobiales bacterium]
MKWVRLVAGVAFWFVLAVVVAFVTAVGARPWGWIAVAVLFAVVPSQLAWSLGGRAAAAIVVVVGVVAGAAVVALTPLPPSRLDAVVDAFVLPSTWHRTAHHREGAPFCVPGCPAVVHGFVADVEPSIALRSLVDAMRTSGFEVRVTPAPGETIVRGRSGRVTLRARFAPTGPSTDVTLRLSSSPGNGELPVVDL